LTIIVTQLDKNSVVTALRELAPKTHNPRPFRTAFEGQIDPHRVTIGYRFGWFAPPIRLVTFSGQMREIGDGTKIEGAVRSGWIFYLLAVWLLIAAPLSLYQYASGGEYTAAFWSLVIAVLLLFLGRAFVRSTQDYVVNEIGRAVQGKVSTN
jgi:hypothetical protein